MFNGIVLIAGGTTAITSYYHIDYAFVSDALIDSTTLKILPPKKWLKLSDHMPLVLDIGF